MNFTYNMGVSEAIRLRIYLVKAMLILLRSDRHPAQPYFEIEINYLIGRQNGAALVYKGGGGLQKCRLLPASFSNARCNPDPNPRGPQSR
jgi:hypothetical protein